MAGRMSHFVKHGRRDLRDGAVDVLGADVDFAVCFAIALPNFVYAAPAVGTAPAIGRYRNGGADQLAVVEMSISKVEHGLGLGYNLRKVNHGFCLLQCCPSAW